MGVFLRVEMQIRAIVELSLHAPFAGDDEELSGSPTASALRIA
jgi:hypothetical protein